jgi:hypothetical protein
MGEVADINILRIALGGRYSLTAVSDLSKHRRDMLPSRVMEHTLEVAKIPILEKIANLIVLYHSARLANGEPIDERMRELIIAWYERCWRGKTRGRPTNNVKEMAVQWEVIEQSMQRPTDQRKVIVADVANKFGLQRSQVYKLIKQLPIEQILQESRRK